MKKIFLTLIVSLFAGATLSSCNSFLDRPALGTENLETYFQNEDECLKAITGCYQGIFWNDWWQISNMVLMTDMCTDDMWMGNTTQDQSGYRDLAHYTGNGEANGTISNFWQYRYKGIFRCNVALERIPDAPISNDNLRYRMLAEAKFIRAYHYFDLLRNFGGVPIVKTMALPSEIIGITRSTPSEVYAFIQEDLEYAIANLPKKSAYGSNDVGRATQGAAQALLAKALIYQEKYGEAKTLLEGLINSGEYDLLPEFGDVWKIETNNSIESLFEIQYNDDLTYDLGGRISVVCGSRDDSGWSWGLPTSNLEKAFLDNGDTERLKWTIICHNATEVPGDDTWNAENPYIVHPDKHKSARVTRKLYIPTSQRPAPYDASHIPLNYRLIRYADVLLLYAEACNATGADGDALDALNRVRTRAKLGELNVSGTALREAIRTERRLELALEGNRLFDIRRWKEGAHSVSSIMGQQGSFVLYNTVTSTDEWELENQKELSNKGYYFDVNRDILFPILSTEVSMSEGSIAQNPNYK